MLETRGRKHGHSHLSPTVEPPLKKRRSRSRSMNGQGASKKKAAKHEKMTPMDTIDPRKLHPPNTDLVSLSKPPSRIAAAPSKPELPSPVPVRSFLVPSLNCVMTSDWNVVREDMRSTQLHQRIEDMKQKSSWSFRQAQKHKPPPRTKTHWDHLLAEMVGADMPKTNSLIEVDE
jgi:hypothetical protein